MIQERTFRDYHDDDISCLVDYISSEGERIRVELDETYGSGQTHGCSNVKYAICMLGVYVDDEPAAQYSLGYDFEIDYLPEIIRKLMESTGLSLMNLNVYMLVVLNLNIQRLTI